MSPLTRLDSHRGAEVPWQKLLATCTVDTLFLTPQWQRVWWEQFGDGAEMLLLCFKKNDHMEGIAPLARHNGTISLIGDKDVCDYNDFLVSRGAESRFYSSLLDHLDKEGWQTMELLSLTESSPTLSWLPDLARERGYSVEVRQEDVSPGLSLPDTWEAYVAGLSKKDRHELRRKLRRLESAEGDVRYYKVSDPEGVERDMEDFFSLMRNSREDKYHFLTEPREQFFRSMAREMASIGIFKLFFLELNGERVASALCFDYGQSRLLYNSGYDPKHSYYSVGLLLKAFAVKDAIEEGKDYFDFLRGSEPYKYDLGAQDRTLYQMVVTRS